MSLITLLNRLFVVEAVGSASGIGAASAVDASWPNGIVAFSRASEARYYDVAGVLQVAPANTLRTNYNPSTHVGALLIEPTATNGIRNPRYEGGVVGGALPTFWQQTATAGGALLIQVVGFPVEDGIPCIDIRIAGTYVSGSLGFSADTLSGIPAAPGQVWARAENMRLVAGSWTNITTINIGYTCQQSDGTSNVAGGGKISSNLMLTPPTSSPLSTQRYNFTSNTTTLATTAFIRPTFAFALTAGAVDFTLRLALTTLEQVASTSAVSSSPMLPPVGAPGASTRAADLVTYSGIGAAAGASVVLGKSLSIGSAAGVGTATAVGQFLATGAASGTSTVLAQAQGQGSSTGVGTATAAGLYLATGLSAGTSTVTAAGRYLATGLSAGVATANAAVVSSGVGSSAGLATVLAQAQAKGVAAGTSTVTAAVVSRGIGNAAGTSTVLAQAQAKGSAAGIAVVTGAGQFIVDSINLAAGTATANAVALYLAAASGTSTAIARPIVSGTSAGVAVATGVGATLVTGVGQSIGVANVVGRAQGQGVAAGTSTVLAQAAVTGKSDGTSVVSAVGQAVFIGVGASVGSSTAVAVGLSTVTGIGASASVAVAGAVGRAISEAIGVAAGASTAMASTYAEPITIIADGVVHGMSNVFGVGMALYPPVTRRVAISGVSRNAVTLQGSHNPIAVRGVYPASGALQGTTNNRIGLSSGQTNSTVQGHV